jgi:hypothetical protein
MNNNMRITPCISSSLGSAAQLARSYAKPAGIIAVIVVIAAVVFAAYRHIFENASKSVKSLHPAEISSGVDQMATVARGVQIMILMLLNPEDLGAARLTCRAWHTIANAASYNIVVAHFGLPLAQRLMESRDTEFVLYRDLFSRVKLKSNRLSEPQDSADRPPRFWKIYGAAGSQDSTELEAVLKDIKSSTDSVLDFLFGADSSLRCSIKRKYSNPLNGYDSMAFAKTPLAIAAITGIVKNAELLIEWGAADAVTNLAGLVGETALSCAVAYGRFDMVRCLLSHGARVDLMKLSAEFSSQPIHSREIMVPPDIQRSFLECLILILSAWKEKIGAHQLSQHKDAKSLLKSAFWCGYIDIVNLMLGFGIPLQVEEGACLRVALDGIINHNLPLLELIHRRQLMNLREGRLDDGSTLLSFAQAEGNTEAEDFLKKLPDMSPKFGPNKV